MKKERLRRPAPSNFRRHWLLAPGAIFLNHGSFGACPRAILKLQAALRRRMEAEPVQFLWRRYEERLEPARKALARFAGARPQDIVFVTNATTGVNAVAGSIKLRRGDELLTTNQDYNACRNVLAETARRAGARLVVARLPFPAHSSDELVEAVLRAVTKRTRLALIDHVTSCTALVLPVARLVRELEARGVDTVVDGAHAPGMVPLDLAALRPAAYTGNLHKWVCAPKGAAFLWVREDLQRDAQPAVISHGNNTPRPGYTAFQDRFDWAGTFDPTAWFCAGEAIHWMGRLLPGGWNELRRRNHDLAVKARRLLCDRLGLEAPCPEHLLGAMAALPLPERFQSAPGSGKSKVALRPPAYPVHPHSWGEEKRDKIAIEQRRLYDEFGIEVPLFRIGWPERRYLRISAQIYNTLEEYEYLAGALEALKL